MSVVILSLMILAGCANLPALNPSDPGAFGPLPFPQGRWQLVHRIEARFPGNHKALMMGALQLDSDSGQLICALMTVEGFTLFSASFNPDTPDALRVTRAVSPFDRPGFAKGLMADLGLLFLAPRGARSQLGSTGGRPVWRYAHRDGTITDITAAADHYRIDRYDATAKRLRSAVLEATQPSGPRQGIAGHILLEAHDAAAYALKMDLVDAVPLEIDDPAATKAF